MRVTAFTEGVQEFKDKVINCLYNTLSNIGFTSLASQFTQTVSMTGSNSDWSTGQVFTKTLTADLTLTISNLHIGVKDYKFSGVYTLTLPAYVDIISGEYDGTKINLIEIKCINSGSGTEECFATISQEN